MAILNLSPRERVAAALQAEQEMLRLRKQEYQQRWRARKAAGLPMRERVISKPGEPRRAYHELSLEERAAYSAQVIARRNAKTKVLGLSERAELAVAAWQERITAHVNRAPDRLQLPLGLTPEAEQAARAARARYHESTVPPLREPGCCQPTRVATVAPTTHPIACPRPA